MNEKIIRRSERILKGVGNHNRIRILDFIAKADETSLWAISQKLDLDFRLASHHATILEKAGLISKHYQGAKVYHELTPYGEKVLEFIKDLK